jgi:hypothetical protein
MVIIASMTTYPPGPRAGHGGIFRFHAQFVDQTPEFLAR